LCRVLAPTERLTDFFQAPFVKIPEHDGIVVGGPEATHCIVEQWLDLLPCRVWSGKVHRFDGQLFAAVAAAFATQGLGRHIARGSVKPPRKDGAAPQSAGFASQQREYLLRNILRQVYITDQSVCSGMDQIYMPLNQLRKGVLRAVLSKALQEFMVVL
jgi:hypothetical protein